MGRSAALPAMGNGEELRQDVLEKDEMNGDPYRDVSKSSRAVDELAGMGKSLAQRAVWVVAGGERVEGAIRFAVRGNGCRSGSLFRRRDATWNVPGLGDRVMNMGLDDQSLNRQG